MSSNGRVDDSGLTTVDAFGTRLANATASDWFAMVAAAAKDGIRLAPTITTFVGVYITPENGAIAGYRDLNVQRWLRAHPLGPVPIAPLGESTHGLGNAIDISTTKAGYAWLAENAARFGFKRIFGSEKWHYQHPGVSVASTSSHPLPTTARPKGTRTMAQVIYLPAFPSMADTDPRIAKIKGYVGGSGLTNFTSKVGLYALVGDSPGTRANVQVSQSDARLNEWCADHTGSLGEPYNISQAGRAYKDLDEFLALCDAYLTLVQK